LKTLLDTGTGSASSSSGFGHGSSEEDEDEKEILSQKAIIIARDQVQIIVSKSLSETALLLQLVYRNQL
jgi:hypothetical protein